MSGLDDGGACCGWAEHGDVSYCEGFLHEWLTMAVGIAIRCSRRDETYVWY